MASRPSKPVTYSRRFSRRDSKRRTDSDEPDRSPSPTPMRSRKRRKFQVSVVQAVVSPPSNKQESHKGLSRDESSQRSSNSIPVGGPKAAVAGSSRHHESGEDRPPGIEASSSSRPLARRPESLKRRKTTETLSSQRHSPPLPHKRYSTHVSATDEETDIDDHDSVLIDSANSSARINSLKPPSTPTRSVPSITYLSRTPNSAQRLQASPEAVQASPGRLLSRTPTAPASLSTDSPSSTSSSPRKPAKDLSFIFHSSSRPNSKKVVPLPPTRGNHGLAKRMLGRSRTDSSLVSNIPGSSESVTSGVEVLPIGLSAHPSSELTSQQRTVDTPIIESNSPDDTPLRRPSPPVRTRTYAGTSRSFLVAIPTSQIPSLNGQDASAPTLQNSQEDEFDVRESYTDLRTRWGVDNSDDHNPFSQLPSPYEARPTGQAATVHDVRVDQFSNGVINDFKTITDLRSKGESRRFMDEVGYLFEGLHKSEGITVRRASALEIVNKLCDEDFARKAKASDFLDTAWTACCSAAADERDKVLDAILAFFAALVARDSHSIGQFADRTHFTSILVPILSCLVRERDPLWLICSEAPDPLLKPIGIGRGEKTMLKRLRGFVSKSGIFSSDPWISTRLCISEALATLSPSLLDPELLPAVASSLISEMRLLPPRITAYSAGMSMLPLSQTSAFLDLPSLRHIGNCLKLLDSFLLRAWDVIPPTSWDTVFPDTASTVEGLLSACAVAEVIVRDPLSETIRKSAVMCFEYALRVLINISHGSHKWCQALVDHGPTLPTLMRLILSLHNSESVTSIKIELDSDVDGGDSSTLDQLYLLLGLLTNLAQGAEGCRESLRGIRVDPLCFGKRSCLQSCRCQSRVSGLECLAQIYTQEEQENAPHKTFLHGHLAILLGLLMRDSVPNRNIILGAVSGVSTTAKLASLIESGQHVLALQSRLNQERRCAPGELVDPLDESTSAGDDGDDSMGAIHEILEFLHRLQAETVD
ncbi:hypothetical protein JAAARDRAFT_602540 [Jaapia argillacea MUCL 33604]|uniref:Wings apart-like protein C-terminal domain-containing protein n=1 Tax=Jaapia argillacea MUCL 33604 TaxID=933084 RepID=A0A067Q2D4_9AGAM|nr:hypothetical protein JAAARDRAFT_602540 [Jaapia argillacea MUCL 33604]